jgi:regulator of replication initiation timing
MNENYVIDVIANLARRVSSLEQQLSATQGNVEKLAEELANTKHLAVSNEQDIAMLDERTMPKENDVETVTLARWVVEYLIEGASR